MLRKFFYALLIALSSLIVSSGELSANITSQQTETQFSIAEHTFKIEYINGIKYLCEYDEDGSLVNITELHE